MFRALADPTRRQILQDLRGGELSAGDIASRFPIKGPSVSRHLSILKGAGLISEPEANRILYSLAGDRLAACVGGFLSAVCPDRSCCAAAGRNGLRGKRRERTRDPGRHGAAAAGQLPGGPRFAGFVPAAPFRPPWSAATASRHLFDPAEPGPPGWRSRQTRADVENAAHRVAVCWDDSAGSVSGVYVPRRDTSSRLAVLAGGRLFPGWQHPAIFRVTERDASIRVEVTSRDGAVRIVAAGHAASDLPPGSVFAGVGSASSSSSALRWGTRPLAPRACLTASNWRPKGGSCARCAWTRSTRVS